MSMSWRTAMFGDIRRPSRGRLKTWMVFLFFGSAAAEARLRSRQPDRSGNRLMGNFI